jgi:leukotriene-A4 hydrolase
MSPIQLPKVLAQRRPAESPETDYSTLSNYKSFKVQNSTFDIELKFDEKIIVGSIKYDLLTLSSISKIVLDSSFLKINSIKVNDEARSYQTTERSEPLGAALVIELEAPSDSKLEVLIEFETTKDSTALQWLKTDKATTDPVDYVFTQLEPIHARALFPCFDTPSIKSTYNARIKSKYPLVFSGLPVTQDAKAGIYEYEQKVPIPSYLVAIASGNFVSAKVGPRSTIYAEPDVIQDAKNEFEEDVENFIKIAEDITTPYIWSTYDFLINPASFPYGGMENPNITFVTPTLISYDKSQVDVIAHELAHSWSGNNVTNASWEHFYLNEGWTVYLERRITSQLPNGDIDEKFRHFQFIQGWNDLVDSIETLPKFEYSKLVQDLKKGKIDPDDTFSSVPYEKGANLLFHLEKELGGVSEFDPFIKFYFTKFSKQSIDTYQFVDSLYEFFAKDQSKIDVLNNFDWDLWLYTPGLPPKYDFDTTLVDEVTGLVKSWVSKAAEYRNVQEFEFFFNNEANSAIYNSFTSPQKILFIDLLLDSSKADKSFWVKHSDASDALISVYTDLNESRNTEIKFRWFKLKLASQKSQYYNDLANWLGEVGRMKYVRPSYRLLNEVDHNLAVKTFLKFKDFYHPIASSLVKKDLGLE